MCSTSNPSQSRCRTSDIATVAAAFLHCSHMLLIISSTERNSISWRGDGQFLVTNVVSTPHPLPPAPKGAAEKKPAAAPAAAEEAKARAPRILQVWERNGVLHSTAERPGAPPPLAPGRRAPPRPPHPPEVYLEHVAWRYVDVSHTLALSLCFNRN